MAENGAFVKDRKELVFTANMPKETVDFVIDVCREYPEVLNVLCGVNSAYCERGTVSQDFFDLTSIYYHRLQWVDDFRAVLLSRRRKVRFVPFPPCGENYTRSLAPPLPTKFSILRGTPVAGRHIMRHKGRIVVPNRGRGVEQRRP